MTNPSENALLRARQTLQIGLNDDLSALRTAFRQRSMETHPDLGGSVEAFDEVKAAYRLLLDYLTELEPGWLLEQSEDEIDIRIVDEKKSPRGRRFEEFFLDALRREHGE
jgi:curved DNA-binding protein CbpA